MSGDGSGGGSLLDVIAPNISRQITEAQMLRRANTADAAKQSALEQWTNSVVAGNEPSQDLAVGNTKPGSMPTTVKLSRESMPDLQGNAGTAPSGYQQFMANQAPVLAAKADPDAALAAYMARLNPPPIGKLGADERYYGRIDPATGLPPLLAQGGPKSPEPRKVGDIRTYEKNGKKITDSWDGNDWAKLGDSPEWQPDQSLVEIADSTSPTGTRMVPRDQAAGQPGKGAQDRVPAGYRVKSDGTLEFIPGGPADPKAHGTRYNNEQNLAAGFAGRMDEANGDLDRINNNPKYAGFDPTSYLEKGLASTNATMTEANQLYRQAQENWVSANLRRESGAAIGIDEMTKEVQKYFPQAGDKPALIDQKARSRMAAEQSMKLASGGAYDQLKASNAADAGAAQDKPPAGDKIPVAVPGAQRAPGIYQTPKGQMRWTGTGWVPAG